MTQTPLTPTQRSMLVDALRSQLVTLERQSAKRLEGLSQVGHARQALMQDTDDATQRAGDDEVEAAVADIDSREFDAVSLALQRIHGSAYGMCADCNEPIAFERLEIEPQTMRCAACETLRERQP